MMYQMRDVREMTDILTHSVITTPCIGTIAHVDIILKT